MATTQANAQLFLGSDMSEPERVAVGAGEVVAFSRPSPDADKENEDSAAIIHLDSSSCVLAVADGLGGIPGGRQASSHALSVFARKVVRGVEGGDGMRESILDGLDAANRAVLESGTGCTTIAVAAIKRQAIRCFHVGDSAIAVVGQRGKLKHLTVAHSPVGYAVESGMLDEAEAMTHAERHVVSNVLGSTEMKIEIGPELALADRDTVILASDGVLDNLPIEELVDAIRVGPLDRVAHGLSETCYERMSRPADGEPSKPDDTTFLIYRPRRPKS